MDLANSSSPVESAEPGRDNSEATAVTAHDLLTQPQNSRLVAGADANTADSHLPTLDLTDFKKRTEALVSRIGPDHGEHFTTAELAKMIDDPSIKGQDAVDLGVLYKLSMKQDPAGADGNSNPSPVVSRADIEALAMPADLQKEKLDLRNSIVLNTFDQADLNHDGRLSAAEINQSPIYSAILKEFPDLAAAASAQGGLTSLMLTAKLKSVVDEIGVENQANFLESKDTSKLADSTTTSLYADSSNPLNSIKMQDVHQGFAGDCFFLANMAEAAKQDPSLIRNAIRDNGDGTYTVTYQGDQAHPVTVSKPTDSELALYNGGSSDGLWAAIMEKAYGKYCADVLKRPNTGFTNEDAMSHGDPDEVMALLTGRSLAAIGFLGKPLREQAPSTYANGLQRTLEDEDAKGVTQALASGEMALVTTNESSDVKLVGLVPNHVYAIVGYTPGQDGGQLILRNPWNDPSSIDGQNVTISMDSLSSVPTWVSFEL